MERPVAAREAGPMQLGGVMVMGDEQFLRDLYNLKYLFGDKWAPAINLALARGPMRRAEILSTINSYSLGDEWSDKPIILHDSILTRTLRKMTKEGLLVRTECTEAFPAKVFYSLAPQIAEFMTLLGPLIDWVRRHPDLIAQAQAYNRNLGEDDDDPLTGTPIQDDNDSDIVDLDHDGPVTEGKSSRDSA
ncbi:winged helix-turn-helix transcriptional regulator [Lentzea sp. NPDC051213]|uniref:winged helix-turn-helix transcriptional regulator n=1 Tax=Lentzea sp. NPDC051213 TaxID=3364126 RepID=UPI0037926167